MDITTSIAALPPGTRLHELIIRQAIGRGGTGVVYTAEHGILCETFVVKEFVPRGLAYRDAGQQVLPLPGQEARFDSLRGKFLDEARMLINLGRPRAHPSLVEVTDAFRANDTVYMCMRFEQSRPLGRILDEEPAPDEATLRAWLFPLLDGLEHAHVRGICHRDIKPSNILIRDADASPVLIDFGAAHWERPDSQNTVIAQYTPAYAAPEQLHGGEKGPWTDIYALSATWFRAIVGVPPTAELLGTNWHAAYADRYAPAFMQALDAGLQRAPERRPRSIAQWRQMFGDAETRPARRRHRTAPATGAGTPRAGGSAIRARRAASAATDLTEWAERSAIAASASARASLVASAPMAAAGTEPSRQASAVPQARRPPASAAGAAAAGHQPRVPVQRGLIAAGAGGFVALLAAIAAWIWWARPYHGEHPATGLPARPYQAESPAAGLEPRSTLSPPPIDTSVDPAGAADRDGIARDPCAGRGSVECRLIERLAALGDPGRAGSAPEILLEMPPGGFRGGDYLTLRVRNPSGEPGYLYVDFFDTEGQVLHLFPTIASPAHFLGARATLAVGAASAAACARQPDDCFIVAPPHGEHLILAVLSPTPLWSGPRLPQVESAADYLATLNAAARRAPRWNLRALTSRD